MSNPLGAIKRAMTYAVPYDKGPKSARKLRRAKIAKARKRRAT